MFITFEANEGAGKSTQARLLANSLMAAGFDVVLTREPGGSPFAEEIRQLLVTGEPDRMSSTTELLLFTAARRDHVERTIQPALAAGRIVICDRYLGSTYALQGAGGMDTRKIDLLFEEFIGLRPDLTLLLDIDVEIGLKRTLARFSAAEAQDVENRFEAKGLAFHRAVGKNFRALASQNPEWVVINADQQIEAVHADILDTVMAHAAMQPHLRKIA